MEAISWRAVKDLELVSETTWSRIEGSPREEDTDHALAARIEGGPLWMLAQQWRMGELTGDDAASPTATTVSWRSRPIGSTQGPREPTDLLEADVEAEPWDADLRLRVQAGQELASLVDAATYRVFLDEFPLAPLPDPDTFPTHERSVVADASTRAFHRTVSGRVADGFEVLAAHDLSELPPTLDTPSTQHALDRLVEWFGRTYPHHRTTRGSNWAASELQYRSTVFVGGSGPPESLTIDDHHGGRLDWWSFDLDAPIDWAQEQLRSAQTVPTTVEFVGMPLSRYWQFEKPSVDFGRVTASTTDLARMMLSEFVLVYGEDWFSVPFDVGRGSVVRLDDIVVTNTFGERFVIPPSGGPSGLSWDRWSTGHPAAPLAGSTPDDGDRLIVFPPVSLSASAGPSIEEVILARDEVANIVWGIEMFVANDLSEPTEMVDFWGDRLLAAPPPPDEPGLHYTLITDVPANWLPFSPRLDRSVTPARATALELIPFVRTANDGRLVATRPLGALLNKEDPPGTYRLAEEAVNRTAQRVVRRFERARSGDGRVHIWVANSRGPAQPQTPSGLRFDVLQVGPE